VVAHESREDLPACLASLRAAALHVEVIVVDNASTDGSAELVRREFPDALLIEPGRNLGFSRANNLGLARAGAAYVLFLNPDAALRPGALEALAGVLDASREVGAVGPRTRDPDGTIQVTFGPALTPRAEWRQRRLVEGVRRRRPSALARAEALAAREHEPAWISGSCLLARRAALEAVGGFDEGFFLYEEDADLCLRLRRAGWRVRFTPAAEVVHRLGRSMQRAPARARLEYRRSHLRYYGKHGGPLALLALRAWLAAGAGLDWLRSLGPGGARRAARGEAVAALRAAVSRIEPPAS
jgi:GT2 family glycosyltransferase